MILTGGYLAYQVVRGMAIQKMDFSLQGISASQDFLTTNVKLKLRITNPTGQTNTLDNLYGNIYANGQYLGYASLPAQIVIGPNGQTDAEIGVAISDLSLLGLMISIASGAASNAVINFTGTAIVDKLIFPVNLSYKVI